MSYLQDYNAPTLALLFVYFATLVVLSFYGSHRYIMVYLYRRYAKNRPDPQPEQRFADDDLPVVTIQLPMFNERYVAERLIDAVCLIDYPQHLLEIQVLDDSTDDTTALVADVVARKAALGHDIELIHREDRTGYKAGALEEGLEVARGEFVAVFDADFIPRPDFVRQTVHYFTDPGVGMVQARWEHINREYSLLTRAQAVLLDGHFVVEHTARNRSGRFFNFNGTAGIWRRDTIADAGGWEHDTLTEDLDLSYRCQLKGWRFVFLRDVTAPSEIPVEMNAFKAQQHRWAKGSIQTAKKMLWPILRSDLPFHIKHEAFHHLTANLAYLLMLLLAVLMPLATIVRVHQGLYETLVLDLPIFLSATFSLCVFYWLSQREIGRPRLEVLRLIPAVLGIGIGISINNAKAVVEALVGHETPFVRTPKYGVSAQGESWTNKLYIKKSTLVTVVEVALGLWFTYAIVRVALMPKGSLFSIPFLVLFQFGFFYVASLSFVQRLRSMAMARARRPS
jgi:cellulose synthase/poly-beta-1,6-N-acetylglucosamine synthase-like glycosyltransferase